MPSIIIHSYIQVTLALCVRDYSELNLINVAFYLTT